MANEQGRKRVHYVVILGVALTLRCVMVLYIAKGDTRAWFFNQASEYGCLAQSLLAGHGYASPFGGSTGPSAFLAPGYPMLVATAFRVFGAYSACAAAALIALQMLIAELTVLALMLLARRLFGPLAANISGALYAVSPPAIGLPVLFWETSLSILLLTAVMLAAVLRVDHPRGRNWAAFGTLCALAMLVNPSLLLTLAAVLLWMTWQRGRFGFRGPMLAVLLWSVLYSPWPICNAYRLHAFVPLRTNLGYELWQGNRTESDGTFDLTLHPNASNEEYARYAKQGELAYMREKSELALAAIKADKMRFATLSLGRFAKFWLNSTSSGSALLSWSIASTSLMSVIGLALLLRSSASIAYLLAIPFAILPAPYYLTHADFRFRLLLDPLAMLLTAFLYQECERWVRKRSRGNRDEAVQTHGLPVIS